VRFLDWVAQSVGDLAEQPTPGKEWVWLVGLLIVTAPGVLAAWWARQAKSESRATNAQVINGHGDAPAMRVELDEKFADLKSDVAGVKADVASVKGEVAGVKAVVTEHSNRFESIEEHLRK
jgi:hypothetical protein